MKNTTKAFTLIEVLLGLTIFSIIALSLYSTFNIGMLLNRRSDEGNVIFREARWSFDRLSNDLQNMRPYNFSNSYSSKTAFVGENSKVSFILATSDGLKVVSYSLKSPEYGSVFKTIIGQRQTHNTNIISRFEEKSDVELLVREETSLAGSLQSDKKGNTDYDTLSINIKKDSLKFLYAYIEGQEENAKVVWKDSWDREYFPSLIRVALAFESKDKSKGPLIIQKDIYIPIGSLGLVD